MKKILALDIKFSLTQIFFFASYGALFGYASVYLLSRGVNNSTIGMALASISAIAFVCQPFVASFADKNKKIDLRYLICGFLIVAMALAVTVTIAPDASVFLICAFVSVGTLLSTIMPLVNTLAFQFEKYGIAINYGLARGLGSASYAVVSFIVGHMVEGFGTDVIPIIHIGFNLLLTAVIYMFVLPKGAVSEASVEAANEVNGEEVEQLSFLQFMLRYKSLTTFVLGTVLVFFAHTIINNFMIQIITPIGGTESQMGTAISLAAILELPTMLMFDKLREKISIKKLVSFAMVMYIVKHAITAFAPSMAFIYVASVCQMFAFAIITPASVYLVNDMVDSKDLVKGQSLIAMGNTASGIIANLVGGMLLDAIGVKNVLLVGVASTVIGAIVVISVINKHKEKNA